MLLCADFTVSRIAVARRLANAMGAAVSKRRGASAKTLTAVELNHSITHESAAAYCSSQGLRLCGQYEACPDGMFNSPVGGIVEGDHWLPVGGALLVAAFAGTLIAPPAV